MALFAYECTNKDEDDKSIMNQYLYDTSVKASDSGSHTVTIVTKDSGASTIVAMNLEPKVPDLSMYAYTIALFILLSAGWSLWQLITVVLLLYAFLYDPIPYKYAFKFALQKKGYAGTMKSLSNAGALQVLLDRTTRVWDSKK